MEFFIFMILFLSQSEIKKSPSLSLEHICQRHVILIFDGSNRDLSTVYNDFSIHLLSPPIQVLSWVNSLKSP